MKDSHVTQQCEHLKKLLATVQEQQTMQLKLIHDRSEALTLSLSNTHTRQYTHLLWPDLEWIA